MKILKMSAKPKSLKGKRYVPLPATNTTDAFHLHDTVGKNVSHTTDTDSHEVKTTQSASTSARPYIDYKAALTASASPSAHTSM